MALQNKLPHPKRYITTHDPKTGLAIIDETIPSAAPFYPIPNHHSSPPPPPPNSSTTTSSSTDDDSSPSPSFAQCYVTSTFPVILSPPSTSPSSSANGGDLQTYQTYLSNPPGLTVSNGTVLRYVDLPPGSLSPMHRTASLDYGVVLQGSIELILDSGMTRRMEVGDICVQRATMHAWRNLSEREWGRMLYVLQPAEMMEGEEKGGIKEDLGGMKGVRGSD